jgi:hypothetical protein
MCSSDDISIGNVQINSTLHSQLTDQSVEEKEEYNRSHFEKRRLVPKSIKKAPSNKESPVRLKK